MKPRARASSHGGRRGTAAATTLALLVAATLALSGAGQPAPEPMLITGARLLDAGAGRYQAVAGVLVDGERIAAVFARLPAGLPAGTRRIDLPGATLVPGLGDMYATAAPSASADADFYYAMALAHGVTMYRTVSSPVPWAASQRDRVRAGDILAPRLWIGAPRLDQQGALGFSTRRVVDAAAARREVAQQHSLGAEWILVSATTGPDVYRAIVGAAHAAKMRVSGEAGATSGLDLIRVGVDAIDRLPFFAKSRAEYEQVASSNPDYPRDDAGAADDYLWAQLPDDDARVVTAQMTRRGLFIIPMLGSFPSAIGDASALKQDPAAALLPARWRDDLQSRTHPDVWPGAQRAAAAAAARGRLLRRVMAAGVRVATGVDVEGGGYNVPGAGVHHELALLVAAGVSPADALRAATVNCAGLLGAGDTLGQIGAGFSADLIAVDGDPLRRIEDLQRIRLIVRGGEVLDRDALLEQARHAARPPQ
jgi:hypothetical protein